MGAQPLGRNVPVFSGRFDEGETNSVEPAAGQRAVGFLPNVDNVDAETQNYMHGASIAALYLAQKLGIFLTFNPDGSGGSRVSCPRGGVVALQQTGGATEFYVCQNPAGMAAGFTDPSLNPTDWALIDFRAIATYTTPYADATGTANAIAVDYPSVIYPVLKDGFVIRVGIATPNLTTTPTIAATFNGLTPTPYVVVKKGKSGLIPLAIGDLYGTCQFEFDQPNNAWILDNPPGHEVQPGSLVFYAGATPPPGVLQLPSAAANISRTAYPALLAAIGTTWGAGDGSTTFGMPFIPPGYSILHYIGLGALGAQTVGSVISHLHGLSGGPGAFGGTNSASLITWETGGIATNTKSAGGSANLPAGVLFNIGIKY